MWDERFRLPVPPVDTVANVAIDRAATEIFLALSGVVFLYGLLYWRRTGRPIVLLLMAGGLLCSSVEPVVDVLGAVWQPVRQQVTAFDIMGRPMPWFIVAGYLFYFGALGSATFLAFERGVSRRQFWIWCCVPMIVDFFMEELMLRYDLYYYYGQQPLILIGKLPLWWVPCNSLGQILGVSCLVLIKPLQTGWRQLSIPLLIPLCDIIAYAAISLPSWIVVNTPVPGWVLQLGGLATCGLAFLLLYGLSMILPSESPSRSAAAAPAWRVPKSVLR